MKVIIGKENVQKYEILPGEFLVSTNFIRLKNRELMDVAMFILEEGKDF